MLARWRESLLKYLEPRLPIRPLLHYLNELLRRPLPSSVHWFHTLGFVILIFLGLQGLTGVLLLCYYKPTAAEAYDSVQFIMRDVRFGWFIRKFHAWGASILVVLLILHLARVFITGAYKKPREFTWVAGSLLFILVLAMGFTGYLLPWNQVSFWGTVVATDSIGKAPGAGPLVLQFMRGGTEVTELTLNRFFAAHVVILPALLTIIIACHIALVLSLRFARMSHVDEKEPSPEELLREGGQPLWPHHLLRVAIAGLFVLGLLITLVIAAPYEDPGPANPLFTPPAIKPDWYFLPVYQLTKVVRELPAFLILNAALAGFILWPFIDGILDRKGERHPRKRKIILALGLTAFLAVSALGVLGYLSEQRLTLFGTTYHFDIYGLPTQESAEKPQGEQP